MNPSARRFENMVVLVTGGSHGIGRATVRRFAADGASVAVNHLGGGGEAMAAVGEVERAGGTAIAIEADVANSESVRQMVAEVRDQLGPIDVLVNNAGITSHVPFVELAEDDWDRVIAVNLSGVFHCCKAVVPEMMNRRSGVVVNVASDLGFMGAADQVHYSASKGGVLALTKAVARAAAPCEVRVNAVAPGAIVTDMLTAYPQEYNEKELALIPLGRWGQPEDIAATICFLASGDASYYAGWVLSPNGGVLM